MEINYSFFAFVCYYLEITLFLFEIVVNVYNIFEIMLGLILNINHFILLKEVTVDFNS